MSALHILKGVIGHQDIDVMSRIAYAGSILHIQKLKLVKAVIVFFNDYLEILILFLGGIKTVSFVSLKFELSSMMPT